MILKGCVIFERTLLSRKKSHNLAWSCAISNIFYCVPQGKAKRSQLIHSAKNVSILHPTYQHVTWCILVTFSILLALSPLMIILGPKESTFHFHRVKMGLVVALFFISSCSNWTRHLRIEKKRDKKCRTLLIWLKKSQNLDGLFRIRICEIVIF